MQVQNIEDWRVTDLAGTRIVKPLPENGNVVIANDDVSMFSSYYWLAPPDYLGKKVNIQHVLLFAIYVILFMKKISVDLGQPCNWLEVKNQFQPTGKQNDMV